MVRPTTHIFIRVRAMDVEESGDGTAPLDSYVVMVGSHIELDNRNYRRSFIVSLAKHELRIQFPSTLGVDYPETPAALEETLICNISASSRMA